MVVNAIRPQNRGALLEMAAVGKQKNKFKDSEGAGGKEQFINKIWDLDKDELIAEQLDKQLGIEFPNEEPHNRGLKEQRFWWHATRRTIVTIGSKEVVERKEECIEREEEEIRWHTDGDGPKNPKVPLFALVWSIMDPPFVKEVRLSIRTSGNGSVIEYPREEDKAAPNGIRRTL
jgi:hypothetical protein